MDMNDFLGGQYLAKTDVDVRGIDAMITGVTTETVGNDQEIKPCLQLKNVKSMLLNKTNVRVLCALFGSDSTNWTGEVINVFNDPSVNFNGATGGLRVREARSNAPTKSDLEQAAQYQKEQIASAKTKAHFSEDTDVPF